MSLYATAHPVQASKPRINKKRRAMLEHALQAIKIIGNIPAPLAPELPPSPPASRSPSPVPTPAPIPTASSSKRKLDAYEDTPEPVKRPRVNKPPPTASEVAPDNASASSSASPPLPSTSLLLSSNSSRPSEPVKPSPVTAAAAASFGGPISRSLTVYEPIRRPRHGIEQINFRAMYDKYFAEARRLKYSGEGRYFASYPQSNASFKPLREPPPKGTPYHTHGGIIALLEMLEGVISFVYAAWCQDHYAQWAAREWAWKTNMDFMLWTKSKWLSYVGSRDNVREKALIGLLHMIEAFTHQRYARYFVTPRLDYMTQTYVREIEQAEKARQVAAEAAKVMITPPEKSLPSPDTDAASANSTPANPNNGTPMTTNESRSDDAARTANRLPQARSPRTSSSSDESISVKQSYIKYTDKLGSRQAQAAREMKNSEKYLSLAIMREHFPHTFGRMVCSTLSANEEYEPDMEDEEGELFWPSQCVTGEGIAWVCLMGRAMVREFGKEFEYKGVAAALEKPERETKR